MSAVRIVGTLGRDAELRIGTDSTAWLCLEIHQGVDSVAVVARKHVGSGGAAAIAGQSTARQLRRGTRVTVHAGGFHIVHTPSPHLVLRDVDFIEHQPVVTARRCGVLEVNG